MNRLEHKNLVFFRDGKPENILPKSLKKRYKAIESNPVEGTLLTAKDKKFIKGIICRYPFSWQFILKCLIKIGRYSQVFKVFPLKTQKYYKNQLSHYILFLMIQKEMAIYFLIL